MNTQELQHIDIHTLLPQHEPFVMVGRLERFDDSTTVSSFEIREDNIFVEDGMLQAPGVIENMAQTCAARIGYYNKYILKEGIRVGFIGAIRDLQVKSLPRTGERIFTTIEVLEDVFGMTLVNARTTGGDGREIAVAQMKIALGDTVKDTSAHEA